MIDNLALAISHGLIALTVWVLLRRPYLDREGPPAERKPKGRSRA
ncbi:hypothetical protein AB5I39_14035 [Sphingomonas sp. MMS24-J45]